MTNHKKDQNKQTKAKTQTNYSLEETPLCLTQWMLRWEVEKMDCKAQFKRPNFHVPNLVLSIKYLKRPNFDSITSEITTIYFYC